MRNGSRERSGHWAILTFAFARAVTLVATVAVVRLLEPSEYGIFALAFTLVTVADALSNAGMSMVIIVRPSLDSRELSSVLGLLLVLGLVVFVIAAASAPLLALSFDESQLLAVVPSLALMIVMSGPGWFYDSLLQREQSFRTRFVLQALKSVAYAVTAVGLAWQGLGVWSLVLAQLVSTLVYSGVGWRLSPTHVRPRLERPVARGLLREGWGYLTIGWIDFLQSTMDNVAVGRVAGSGQLGFYSLSYRLAELPYHGVAEPLARASAPGLSRHLVDGGRPTSSIYVTTLERIVAVCWLLSAVMFATSDVAVRVVFGADWAPAGDVIAALAVWSSLRVVTIWLSWLLVVTPNARRVARTTAMLFPVFITLVVLGASADGATGAAIGLSAHALLVAVAFVSIALKQSVLDGARLARVLVPFGVAAIAAAASGRLVIAATDSRSDVVTFLIGAFVVIIVYAPVVLTLTPLRATLARLRGTDRGVSSTVDAN